MKKADNEYAEFYKRIGGNLKILRKNSGKSQEELCELLEKSQAMLSKYESGAAKMGMELIIRICDIFSVALGDFLEKDLTDTNEFKNVVSKEHSLTANERLCLSDRELYMYYMNTDGSDIMESIMIVNHIDEKKAYIDFVFEALQNMQGQQIYEGKLVVERLHYFFYITNAERDERGLLVTYRYPYKEKRSPFCLLGMLVSLSHGKTRPCVQKCIVSSDRLPQKIPRLKEFLELEYDKEGEIDTDYVKYLRQDTDKKLYEWVKGLGTF